MEFYNPFGGLGNVAPEKVRYTIIRTTDSSNRTVYQLIEQINNDVEGATKKGYDIIFTSNEIVVNPGTADETTLQSELTALNQTIGDINSVLEGVL